MPSLQPICLPSLPPRLPSGFIGFISFLIHPHYILYRCTRSRTAMTRGLLPLWPRLLLPKVCLGILCRENPLFSQHGSVELVSASRCCSERVPPDARRGRMSQQPLR